MFAFSQLFFICFYPPFILKEKSKKYFLKLYTFYIFRFFNKKHFPPQVNKNCFYSYFSMPKRILWLFLPKNKNAKNFIFSFFKDFQKAIF